MTDDLTRRDFLGVASLAALALEFPADAALARATRWPRAPGPMPNLQARPFDLHDVRLRRGVQLDERYVAYWNVGRA